MRSLKHVVAAALAVAAVCTTLPAQEGFLRPPVFLAQPGIVTVNAISPVDENADAESYFNIRFATAIPTASPWLTFIAGTQWLPNGPSVGGVKQNQPGFFYGAIIPVALVGQMTGGVISLSIDPLGVFGGGLGGTTRYAYGHDFFLEAAFVASVGQMMRMTGPWSGLGVYFLIDQQITHAPVDADGDRDYWSPVLLYGLSLQLAPWR